jgi:hypothetical protein
MKKFFLGSFKKYKLQFIFSLGSGILISQGVFNLIKNIILDINEIYSSLLTCLQKYNNVEIFWTREFTEFSSHLPLSNHIYGIYLALV